jgi:hypothetical protein
MSFHEFELLLVEHLDDLQRDVESRETVDHLLFGRVSIAGSLKLEFHVGPSLPSGRSRGR